MKLPAEKLSCYILTFNSEKYLASVIRPIRELIDDLVIVDSGSVDKTEEIAKEFGARFIVRRLDDFSEQRRFALDSCQYSWVLCLDSDEIPNETFVHSLAKLKKERFLLNQKEVDAYKIKRYWIVLGQKIHSFYPIESPDYPVRLFNKDKVTFGKDGKSVHESPTGYDHFNVGLVEGSVLHYSCNSIDELNQKMNLYTTLAAAELYKKEKKANWLSILSHPPFAWIKWYIMKQGWKDGLVGLILGKYAFDYTYQKYLKLKYDFKK